MQNRILPNPKRLINNFPSRERQILSKYVTICQKSNLIHQSQNEIIHELTEQQKQIFNPDFTKEISIADIIYNSSSQEACLAQIWKSLEQITLK